MNTKLNGLRLALVVALFGDACAREAQFVGNGTDDKRRPEVVADQEFPASRRADDSLTLKPQFGLIDQALTMRVTPPRVAMLKQVERGVGLETFTQGHEGSLSDEEFDVSSVGKLDLLVVIDDSGSMAEEQDGIKTELKSLTKFLKSTDWQIAVVTTSSSCLRGDPNRANKIIKSTDADAEAAFEKAIDAGTNGAAEERGIYQASRAFQGKCAAGDYTWLRADSNLGVLFISDEENYCTVFDCPNGSKPDELVDLLTGPTGLRPKTNGNKVKAYALTWDDDENPDCKNPNGESKGTRYREVVTKIGGISGNICDMTKYAMALEQISKDVSRGFKSDVDVKFQPDQTTLLMTLDGKPFLDFEVVGKKIKLKSLPPDALKLRITYRYDSMPKFDRWNLKEKAAPNTLEVFVNNQPVDPAKVTFDKLDNEFVLDDMPADKAEIKVKFRRDEPLPKHFDTSGHDMPEGILEVKVAGQVVSDVSYDPVTKLLTFGATPADGADISVSYDVADKEIRRYAAGVVDPTNVRHGVAAKDATTGDAIPVTVDGSELVFDEADVVDGRDVVVSYDYGNASDVMSQTLPEQPIDGSVTVDVVSGDDCLDSVTIEGQNVSFRCNGDELEEVKISYSYIAERFASFTVPGAFSRDAHFQVFVDGAGVPYTRDGSTIHIDAARLTDDSRVRIIVIEG